MGFGNWFGSIFRRREPEEQPVVAVDKIVESLERNRGPGERSHALPAWALMLRSPYDPRGASTSWLGGRPSAPAEFQWPRDGNGAPEHFVAQIDLASLAHNPITGSRPPGLPAAGALLVFFGGLSGSVHVVDEEPMSRAVLHHPPGDTPPLRQSGFSSDAEAFPCWPVDPVVYLDTNGERPIIIRDPFSRPGTWITNCGVATLEAVNAFEALIEDLRILAERNREVRVLPDARSAAYARLMKDRAPEILSLLKDWETFAASQDPAAPVDLERLEALFAVRTPLARELQAYSEGQALAGDPQAVWNRLRQAYPGMAAGDFSTVPEAYRPFVTAWVCRWRGHRLFGLGPPSNTFEDFYGRDCVVTVHADDLLQTQTERETAFSIWCPRADLKAGRFDRGQFVRHIGV